MTFPLHSLAGLLLLFILLPLSALDAAELLLPLNRTAYLRNERIEIAIVGLAKDEKARVELVPDSAVALPLRFELTGDGGTVNAILPGYALQPARYALQLNGAKQSQELTIASGYRSSDTLTSQTIADDQIRQAGGNFSVSNAFVFGLLDQGQPSLNLRRLSPGLDIQQRLIAMEMPSLIYMYYTGYVLHKPWGTEKSWEAADMTEAMRLFNFHAGQRLRRFSGNIISVGTIDEPGLSWGKTPAGGMASGYPGWDGAAWYEERGLSFTNDPAALSDADWMKYLTIRCGILGEQNEQAKKDLQTVCRNHAGGFRFSTDLYAPHALMDGTDPWNQRINHIPSTHVFLDWGGGKLSVIGGLYLEKSHQPDALVAHAMNGQLFGERVPQPQTRFAYHLMLNSMLAAGLESNWWLNYGGMSHEDLAAVNEPAQRIGPVLRNATLLGQPQPAHDVAVLWSFTELGMRLKDITAKEASKKTGEQIALMIADLPENAVTKEGRLDINAYSVGTNYKSQVLNMHQSLNRAGYPAHIVHERVLSSTLLKHKGYRTLVIVGQTFDLPEPVRQVIDEFVAGGGQVLVDATSTVTFPGAKVVDANLKDAGYRWSISFALKESDFGNKRDFSYSQTNHFMDRFARAAVPAVKAAMRDTASKPAISTDSDWLGCERRIAGDCQVIAIINGHEALPETAADKSYYLYNYAPYEATVALPSIPVGHHVYVLEGLDWKQARKVDAPDQPQKLSFAAGEMKLFISTTEPIGDPQLRIGARYPQGISVHGHLGKAHVVWPVTLTLTAPNGQVLATRHTATGIHGELMETLPLSDNAAPGEYTVAMTVSVPGGPVTKSATFERIAKLAEPQLIPPVRVVNSFRVQEFLQSKAAVTIAVGHASHRPLAEQLAQGLRERGLTVTVRPEAEVWTKATYPRVWDPSIAVWSPDAEDRLKDRPVSRRLTIETTHYNRHRVADDAGQAIKDEWRQPGTLLTVTGAGCAIEENGRFDGYEAGCRLYVTDQKRIECVSGRSVETQTTPEVRQRWAREWAVLEHHVGGFHLVPQLPEAVRCSDHLILLGDSTTSELVRFLQAGELLDLPVDAKYPGPGKSLIQFAFSPFAVEKNLLFIGASDMAGLKAGVDGLPGLEVR